MYALPEGANRRLRSKQFSTSAGTGHAFMLASTPGMGQNSQWCRAQQQGSRQTVLARKGCTSAKPTTTQVYTLSLPACGQQDILQAVLQPLLVAFAGSCHTKRMLCITTAPHINKPISGNATLWYHSAALQLHRTHTAATNSTASAVCCIAVPIACTPANTLPLQQGVEPALANLYHNLEQLLVGCVCTLEGV